MIDRFILALAVISLSLGLVAQEPWQLAKDKDGIKVYTRHVEGYSFKEYKAEATMKGEISAFVTALKDVESYPEWISNCESVRLLDSTDTYLRYYMQTHVPGFFVRNRDLVSVLEFTYNKPEKTLEIAVHAEPDHLPIDEDYVRVPQSNGYWRMVVTPDDSVRVTLQMHALPGGSIPAWVANSFLEDGPYSDFKNLRERVLMKKYQGASYQFLEE